MEFKAMEMCLDRISLNGLTQWDFQIVRQHFASSHKEAGRVIFVGVHQSSISINIQYSEHLCK